MTARFEEHGLFAVAPTNILGLSTRYSLGDRGAINLIGMYQREQSAFTRPALGFEASANLVGGINTELHFKPSGITSFLNKLVSKQATAPSLLDVNAEFAFTKPDPNRSARRTSRSSRRTPGVDVSLRETSWEFGSRPQQANGLEDIGFAGGFDPADAVALTWQNLIPVGTRQALELRPQDIDTLIRLAGRSESPETVSTSRSTPTPPAASCSGTTPRAGRCPRRDFRPRWRSMVTSLSPTGLDLSRDDFLEFWVFQPAGAPADSRGAPAGDRSRHGQRGRAGDRARQLHGQRERIRCSPAGSTWAPGGSTPSAPTSASSMPTWTTSASSAIGPTRSPRSAAGRWTSLPLCDRVLTNAVAVFPWGDLSSRCTRGNGQLDTEDLNGDGVLDADGPNENVFRYVVNLADDDFFVRDGVPTTDAQGNTSPCGSSTGSRSASRPPRSTRRRCGWSSTSASRSRRRRTTAIRTSSPDSRWLGCGSSGRPGCAAPRRRSPGSREQPDCRTAPSPRPSSPPRTSRTSDTNRRRESPTTCPGRVVTARRSGTQINEKSLRIIATQLGISQRAEAYLRFPAGPQNLLTYRTLKVWFRGRGPGWEEGDLQAFIKLGSDNDNFYLYRTAAKSTHLGAGGGHRSGDLATTPRRRGEPMAERAAAIGGSGMRRRSSIPMPTWPAKGRTW